jgi:hypothetical protein
VDDRSDDPRYWRDKAVSFRAQAETLLARAREFEEMAARMEAERADDDSLSEDATAGSALSRLLHRSAKARRNPASAQQPALRVVR